MTDFEVLILGGGPAGAAAAIALRQFGCSVLLVEASSRPRQRLGETLPAKALPLLDHLGVGASFRQLGHLPMQAVRSAWGGPELHDRLALADPHGHGWHLDRQRFDAMLLSAAQERGTEVRAATRVVEVSLHANRWRMRLRSAGRETAVHADFLLDATGRGGFVGRRRGLRSAPIDRLVGISRRYSGPARADQPWTLIEAVPQGWWYSAPLPDGDILVVFMTDADLMGSRAALAYAWMSWFAEAGHTRDRLHERSARSGWKLQSAASAYTAAASGESWLPIGDAALACDPLAGQGLTIALETGLAAAHVVADWRIHSTRLAQRYHDAMRARWREYSRQRIEIYRGETRWANMPFWSRRQRRDRGALEQSWDNCTAPLGRLQTGRTVATS